MFRYCLVLTAVLRGTQGVDRRDLVRREIGSAAAISPISSLGKSQISNRPLPPGRSHSCEDFVSHVECKGTRGYDQSCIFHCAYLTPDVEGRWVVTLLMENSSNSTEVDISDWDMPAIRVEFPLTVQVKRFGSKETLQDFARQWTISHHRGLSVLFRALWQDRWAHALFDGLYPAYVSLARFGLAKHAFTPVAILSNYTRGLDCRLSESQFMGLSGAGIYTGIACQMEEALRLFGAGQETSTAPLLRINELREDLQGSSMLFDHLVSGSAHLGEYASLLALPGTQTSVDQRLFEESEAVPNQDLLGDFADRLYAAHGLRGPARSPAPSARQLKVLITSNKRMSPEEVAEMTQLAETASAGASASAGLDVRFIDWSTIQPFKAQLELLRETDILVSGIGTALFYSAFLPFGSVCINTGWKDEASVPTYGEDILGLSNRRTRFLYVPLEKLRRGITAKDVELEIHRAAALISEGKVVPFSPDENLSIFGRIIRELSLQSERSRRGLQGKGQEDGGFLCHQRPTGQTSLADLVFERNLDAKNLLFQLDPMTLADACQLDIPLLRELKRKYNLTKALGLHGSHGSCECVACEACGFS
mmetsp:Transcript_12849/g.22284  ORF Transcript_12849/g.22284 Transcript_12849/m.22284 type:complete len:593 (-) Transcript_12849:3-1781(-)